LIHAGWLAGYLVKENKNQETGIKYSNEQYVLF